jgi:dienelactone hydrolase
VNEFFTPKAGAAELLRRKPSLSFNGRTRAQWQTWRRRFRAALVRLMGDTPPALPLHVRRVGMKELEGYSRETLLFNPDPFSTVSAYVLTPDGIRSGERRPAVLCAHGHGEGKIDLIDATSGNYKEIAVRLCRDEGYIVIAPDWRSFGERSDSSRYIEHWKGEHGADGCDLSYMLYGYFGYHLLTLNVTDARRCIDYLVARADVDKTRIGMVGLSYGGTMTTFTAAVDRRIKAAVISCYLSTIADALGDRGRGNTCGSQFLFGLRAIGEIADVAGLIAPRACMVQIGKRDECFVDTDALAAYRHVERIYHAAGASKHVELDHFNGAHELHLPAAVDFLNRRLGN